jgi:hypothetical protein
MHSNTDRYIKKDSSIGFQHSAIDHYSRQSPTSATTWRLAALSAIDSAIVSNRFGLRARNMFVMNYFDFFTRKLGLRKGE